MISLIRPDNFGSRVTAFFTGRDPGADLRKIGKITGTAEQHIYLPVQKHTDTVIVLDFEMDPKIADAVVTKRKDVLIGIQVADCVPILLYDPEQEVIGAVHAGWRGTAAGILRKTIRMFSDRFNCSPSEIRIAMGPSIGTCCYEVDPEVAHAVEKASGPAGYIEQKGAKCHVDLPLANRHQALTEGITPGNIWSSGDCTFCNPGRYCSYRYAKGPTCRQGGFIGMSRNFRG